MATTFKRPRQMHAVSQRESWDKIVLGLAFLIGVGGGLIIKIAHLHPFIAAGFSAAVLIAYALAAFYTTHLRLEPEVVGDNCYYLGFLFTLASLSVTLYFVVEADEALRSQLIPEVISGFGVALSSTIVGVFLRVLMMQFRVDIVAREHQTRLELDEAARSLRAELARSIEQLKYFTVESLQLSAEREGNMRRETEQATKDMHALLLEAAGQFSGAIEKSIREQSSAAVEAIRETVTTSASAAVNGITGAFDDLGRVAQDQRQRGLEAADALKARTDAVLEALSKLGENSEKLSQAIATNTARQVLRGDELGREIELGTASLSTKVAIGNQSFATSLEALVMTTQSGSERFASRLDDLSKTIEAIRIRMETPPMTGATPTTVHFVTDRPVTPPPLPPEARV